MDCKLPYLMSAHFFCSLPINNDTVARQKWYLWKWQINLIFGLCWSVSVQSKPAASGMAGHRMSRREAEEPKQGVDITSSHHPVKDECLRRVWLLGNRETHGVGHGVEGAFQKEARVSFALRLWPSGRYGENWGKAAPYAGSWLLCYQVPLTSKSS